MQWIELTITVPRPVSETASQILFEYGATSILEGESSLEAVRLQAHMRATPTVNADIAGLKDRLRQLLHSASGRYEMQEAPVEINLNAPLPPIRATVEPAVACQDVRYIGNYLELAAPGQDRGVDERKATIWFEPSTSEQPQFPDPATRLVAVALERHLSPGANVVDTCAGDGFLSLVAARLGAGRVLAYEDDSTSIETLRDCVSNNHLDGVISVNPSDQLTSWRHRLAGRVGLAIVHNVNTRTAIELLPTLRELLASNGLLVFGGVKVPTTSPVHDAAREAGFTEVDVIVDEEHACHVYLCGAVEDGWSAPPEARVLPEGTSGVRA